MERHEFREGLEGDMVGGIADNGLGFEMGVGVGVQVGAVGVESIGAKWPATELSAAGWSAVEWSTAEEPSGIAHAEAEGGGQANSIPGMEQKRDCLSIWTQNKLK